MSRLLFNGMANLIESGISKGTAEEIHALFQALEMSPDKLQEFLKSQSEGANRLQGTFVYRAEGDYGGSAYG